MYRYHDGKKWAQLTPEERAWERMKEAGCLCPCDFEKLPSYTDILLGTSKKRTYTRQEHKAINKYRQLRSHWCKLYNENKEKE